MLVCHPLHYNHYRVLSDIGRATVHVEKQTNWLVPMATEIPETKAEASLCQTVSVGQPLNHIINYNNSPEKKASTWCPR